MIKNILVLVIFFATNSTFAGAPVHDNHHHMDLEMTSREYRALLDKKTKIKFKSTEDEPFFQSQEDIDLDTWLAVGKRLLDWVDLINSKRSATDKLSFTSEATQGGNPVSSPRIYSYPIIKDQWAIVDALLPRALRDVIFENGPLTEKIPLTERAFIEWGIQVTRAYDITARYKINRDYTKEYAERVVEDVRGYLDLKGDPKADEKLADWEKLAVNEQTALTRSLVRICLNNMRTKDECNQLISTNIKNNSILSFKRAMWPMAEDNYYSFFVITKYRTDATWDYDANTLLMPFADPQNDAVKNYLKENIEQEFSWLGWRLGLNFVPQTDAYTAHVVFVPGVTPNVNDLAGSIITMDANTPLTEYDSQWTIRHEYGHVVGLPDCYVEFFDEDIDAFVSYQLDVTNLMCSRRGKFKQTHFDEISRVYKGGSYSNENTFLPRLGVLAKTPIRVGCLSPSQSAKTCISR